MAGVDYDVRANLIVQARQSLGATRRLAGDLRQIGQSLRTMPSATRQAVNQMVAFGAAALGLRAGVQAFTSLTRSAVGYTAELEKTRIGLQSVLMAVENTDWETAGRRAGAAFNAIREMAIKSPATSAEMFSIFNGIVGPVEAAGFSMKKVLDITNDTTLAASALGVDFQQASRDINMMVRGTAGVDVKLFSMLRSTGAIKENTEAFNALSPEKRVEAVGAALKKFAAGAQAYGSSWVGVTSTLKDLIDNLKASAMAPVLKTIGSNIERFNSYILAHRMELETFLTNVGRSLGNRLETLFQKAQMGFEWVLENWDRIVDRFHQVVSLVKEVAPQIARAAIAWEAVSLARNAVGAGLAAGGGLMNLATGAVESPLLAGLLARGATGSRNPAAELGGLFGQMGRSSGGAGTTASLFGMMGGATGGVAAGAGAGGGGSLAALAATLGALTPVFVAIGAALAVVLAIGVAFADQWRNMASIFGTTGGQVLTMLYEFGRALWDTLAPILKIIGSVLLVPLTALWIVFTGALRTVIFGLTWLLRILAAITGAIYEAVRPAFDLVFGLFKRLADWLTELFSKATSWLRSVEKAPVESAMPEAPSHDPNTDFSRWLNSGGLSSASFDLSKAPKGAVNLTQDFRGSRISVRQEFKGDQDPDRIVMAMVSDITRQAESRISSGYAGALTR